jgi:hypothetical protein
MFTVVNVCEALLVLISPRGLFVFLNIVSVGAPMFSNSNLLQSVCFTNEEILYLL